MTERFVYYTHKDHNYVLDTPKQWLDFIEMLGDALSTEEIVDLLNEQDQRIQELESQLRQCQVNKDNGRFKVWQVPPIKEGTKIGFTTTLRVDD